MKPFGSRTTLLLLASMLLFIASPIPAAELFDDRSALIQIVDKGEIDWTNGLVRASGIGAPDGTIKNLSVRALQTERKAKIGATRNLLEVLKKIRVDSATTVDSYFVSSDFVRDSLHQTARDARIVQKRDLSDEQVEVIVEVSIKGNFLQALLPGTGSITLPEEGRKNYTGLIIDAAGLGIKPALGPRILDEKGREVYGISLAGKEAMLTRGLAGYVRNLQAATDSSRIMENPLIVKGLHAASPAGVNIVISRQDAERLQDTSDNLNFFRECRVIIVTD